MVTFFACLFIYFFFFLFFWRRYQHIAYCSLEILGGIRDLQMSLQQMKTQAFPSASTATSTTTLTVTTGVEFNFRERLFAIKQIVAAQISTVSLPALSPLPSPLSYPFPSLAFSFSTSFWYLIYHLLTFNNSSRAKRLHWIMKSQKRDSEEVHHHPPRALRPPPNRPSTLQQLLHDHKHTPPLPPPGRPL